MPAIHIFVDHAGDASFKGGTTLAADDYDSLAAMLMSYAAAFDDALIPRSEETLDMVPEEALVPRTPAELDRLRREYPQCSTHCCPVHGCKYNYAFCPVKERELRPVYDDNNGCEFCEEARI